MSPEQTAIALIKVYDRLRGDPPELWEREAAALAWAIAQAFDLARADRDRAPYRDFDQLRSSAGTWRLAEERHNRRQAELEEA